MESVHFPISDCSVATDAAAFRGLIDRLVDELERPRTLVVPCQGGLGRSGLVVAAVLVAPGEWPATAIIVTFCYKM